MTPHRQRWLQWASNLGLAAGLFLVFIPLGMRAYGHWAQTSQRRQAVHAQSQARAVAAPRAGSAAWEATILQIPSIGVDAAVEEGDSSWYYIPGPAHEPGTAAAGQPGNCVIAAHRNMWDATFARLPDVKAGETVALVTATRRYTYRVVRSREVGVDEVALLRATAKPTLTLYTCMLPMSEDRRWVVQAILSGSAPVS